MEEEMMEEYYETWYNYSDYSFEDEMHEVFDVSGPLVTAVRNMELYVMPVVYVVGLVLNVVCLPVMWCCPSIRRSSKGVYLIVVTLLDLILSMVNVIHSPGLGRVSMSLSGTLAKFRLFVVYTSFITGHLLVMCCVVDSLLRACLQSTRMRIFKARSALGITAVVVAAMATFAGYVAYHEVTPSSQKLGRIWLTIAVGFQIIPSVIMLACMITLVVAWRRSGRITYHDDFLNGDIDPGGALSADGELPLGSSPSAYRDTTLSNRAPQRTSSLLLENRDLLRQELVFTTGLTVLAVLTLNIGSCALLQHVRIMLEELPFNHHEAHVIHLVFLWSTVYHEVKALVYVLCWKDLQEELLRLGKTLSRAWCGGQRCVIFPCFGRRDPHRLELMTVSQQADDDDALDSEDP